LALGGVEGSRAAPLLVSLADAPVAVLVCVLVLVEFRAGRRVRVEAEEEALNVE